MEHQSQYWQLDNLTTWHHQPFDKMKNPFPPIIAFFGQLTIGRVAVIVGFTALCFDTPYNLYNEASPLQLGFYSLFNWVNRKWMGSVSDIVVEPYLDEVFHIPQTQAYCAGSWTVWDSKITTPPGLYVLNPLFNWLWGETGDPGCTKVDDLRTLNSVFLWVGVGYAIFCRALIARTWKAASGSFSALFYKREFDYSDLHTGINIGLFPLLFFFSGLYYTDVLSTVMVLSTYVRFLRRKGAYTNSSAGLLVIFINGLLSLTTRQTNIFWVAVFLGGLELVRTLESNKLPATEEQPIPSDWKEAANIKYEQYSRGYIHDLKLQEAGVHDFVLCAVSIAVAAVHQPFLVLRRLWPYILLLISFGAFVIWNGGVVLGDKSNHVATIHLPQMLYIWPLVTFFSFPLMLPPLIHSLLNLSTLLQLPSFPRLRQKYQLTATYIGIALFVTLVIIKFNTIIHPFTLADNRHYMFYVFRYTILRHPLIRYLLAPIYLFCAWGVYLTLCPLPIPTPKSVQRPTQPQTEKSEKVETPAKTPPQSTTENGGPTASFVLILLLTSALQLITAPLVEPRYFILPWVMWRLNIAPMRFHAPAPPKPSPPTAEKVDATAQTPAPLGSASTWPQSKKESTQVRARNENDDDSVYAETEGEAPMEEVKEKGVVKETLKEGEEASKEDDDFWESIRERWRGYDYRLFVETAWFLAVNAVTGYVFLYKGFEWESEPGKVQRFMW